MSLQSTIVRNDDGNTVVSVFVPGRPPVVGIFQSDSSQLLNILDAIADGDESVVDLFDVAQAVASKFERLSERVTVANGRVYFDGDEVNDSISKQIVRFMDEGADFMPLVRFLEKVQQNPQEHSRENLYRWLDAADFTIAHNGDIIGYKGIGLTADGGYASIHSGRAIVDGEVVTGRIPNKPGSIIEMPRSEVTHDPAIGCHYGLHVGTWDYAHSFGNGGVLEVRVNPRDVVSVPTDSGDAKLRTCRYEVREILSEPYTRALLDEDDEWGDFDEWGEYDEDDTEF